MFITIHQPEHIPWLGFFDKVRQVDVFISLDNVQYRKNYFQNRNKIRTFDGNQWVTVPVLHKGKSGANINAIEINNSESSWKKKYLNAISLNYSKAQHFEEVYTFLEEALERKWARLLDLNNCLLEFCFNVLGITTKVVRASSLNLQGVKGDLILEICQEMKAKKYLSGISGKDYLDSEAFKKNNVAVEFHEFYHPIYSQFREPFIPCMSIIDLLMHYGSQSLSVIEGKGVPKMEKLFL